MGSRHLTREVIRCNCSQSFTSFPNRYVHAPVFLCVCVPAVHTTVDSNSTFAWLPLGWYGTSLHKQFTEIARDELRLTGDELGSGAFGVAMKAYHIPTGQDVVVKTLKSGKATEAAVCRWMPCVMWY